MRKMDKNSPEYQFVRQLIANIKCVACSQKYSESDFFIMGQRDDVWMLMVSCSHCKTQGMILAMIKEQEQIELITDLTPEELVKVENMPSISVDDVLDLHRFLKDFEGDFRELFEKDLPEA